MQNNKKTGFSTNGFLILLSIFMIVTVISLSSIQKSIQESSDKLESAIQSISTLADETKDSTEW